MIASWLRLEQALSAAGVLQLLHSRKQGEQQHQQ
jgi:hypothetical protein